MRLGHCAPALATMLLACAAREPGAAPAAVPMLAVDARGAELLEAEQRLEASLLATPDCPAAHEHLRALCALAEAICAESQRDQPAAAEPDPRCADARTRCGRAQSRVQELCPRG